MPSISAPVIAAGIGAVGSVAGGLIGGGKGSGGSQQASSAPWAPQQPFIQQGLTDAQTNYANRQATGPYSGEYYAGQNGLQTSAIQQAAGWAGGPGAGIPGMTAGTAGFLQSGAPGYVNNATNMAANGAGSASPLAGVLNGYATGQTPAVSVNGQLSGALNNAAIAGAGRLNSFANGQQQVMNQSLADPTQGLISSAGQYMNASPVQSAIDSTNAQIDQTLHEQTVPGLNRAAAAGGALNSSRAGMAESMANENAALAKGSADSSILNNAYNTGLSTAAAERNAGLTTGMYAANSGLVDNTGLAQGEQAAQTGQSEFGTTSALGALGTGLNYNLGLTGLNANTRLQANGQLGNGVNMGVNAAGQAGTQAAQNFALGSGAGSLQQQGAQTADNNALATYNGNDQRATTILNDYMNVVGHPYGSQSASSSNLPSNLGGNLLGGAAAGAGLAQQLGGSSLFSSFNPDNSAYNGSNYNYNPVSQGYSGDPNSAGAGDLQSLGFFNPLSK